MSQSYGNGVHGGSATSSHGQELTSQSTKNGVEGQATENGTYESAAKPELGHVNENVPNGIHRELVSPPEVTVTSEESA